MADTDYLQPILESYGQFRPLKTIPYFVIHLICQVAIEVFSLFLVIKGPDRNNACHEYFVLIYLHAGLWMLTFIFDQIVKRKHVNLRVLGYLDFYNKTKLHRTLPFYIVSLWNAVILIIQSLMQHLYSEKFTEKCLNHSIVSPIGYIFLFITLEYLVLCWITISYIRKVSRFNKSKVPPDVQKEEWNTVLNPPETDIGAPMTGEKLHDFLQKQADLIRFLKEHNAKLGEKLMVLSTQAQTSRGFQNIQPQPAETVSYSD